MDSKYAWVKALKNITRLAIIIIIGRLGQGSSPMREMKYDLRIINPFQSNAFEILYLGKTIILCIVGQVETEKFENNINP